MMQKSPVLYQRVDQGYVFLPIPYRMLCIALVQRTQEAMQQCT